MGVRDRRSHKKAASQGYTVKPRAEVTFLTGQRGAGSIVYVIPVVWSPMSPKSSNGKHSMTRPPGPQLGKWTLARLRRQLEARGDPSGGRRLWDHRWVGTVGIVSCCTGAWATLAAKSVQLEASTQFHAALWLTKNRITSKWQGCRNSS